ncbi:MAG: hypothetical protein IKV55_02755 [Oscillospiraceae bacterium]|nr:hypothetical protein [Oscillospiraceae bacterium]
MRRAISFCFISFFLLSLIYSALSKRSVTVLGAAANKKAVSPEWTKPLQKQKLFLPRLRQIPAIRIILRIVKQARKSSRNIAVKSGAAASVHLLHHTVSSFPAQARIAFLA